MDFDYKKHSLERLETWVRDSLVNSKATPQEIYDTIKKVVTEEYYYFKHHTGRCYELLSLLNGNGNLQEQVKIHGDLWDTEDSSKERKSTWTSFWEENYYPDEYKKPKVKDIMPPWGHSDMEALQYTEEELNAMCDKAKSDEEKEQCREYNLREAEYYDKRAKIDMTYDDMISSGYEMTDDGFWIPPQEENNKKRWILPTQLDGITGDCYINLPDDLLELANLKEGDKVNWIDNGDGTYTMTKVSETIKIEDC